MQIPTTIKYAVEFPLSGIAGVNPKGLALEGPALVITVNLPADKYELLTLVEELTENMMQFCILTKWSNLQEVIRFG